MVAGAMANDPQQQIQNGQMTMAPGVYIPTFAWQTPAPTPAPSPPNAAVAHQVVFRRQPHAAELDRLLLLLRGEPDDHGFAGRLPVRVPGER